jgi:hypothetical protein
MTDVLLLTFVFLIAGVVAVPIATRLGLGSVLGYLIAGIAISPLLSWLHVDLVSIQHFAEFGVVMMLFLVGLELEPKLLWQMRHKLLGLGGLQVSGTTLAVMLIAILAAVYGNFGIISVYFTRAFRSSVPPDQTPKTKPKKDLRTDALCNALSVTDAYLILIWCLRSRSPMPCARRMPSARPPGS